MQETTALIIFISASLYTVYKFAYMFLGPKPVSGCASCIGSCGSKKQLNTLKIQKVKNSSLNSHYEF